MGLITRILYTLSCSTTKLGTVALPFNLQMWIHYRGALWPCSLKLPFHLHPYYSIAPMALLSVWGALLATQTETSSRSRRATRAEAAAEQVIAAAADVAEATAALGASVATDVRWWVAAAAVAARASRAQPGSLRACLLWTSSVTMVTTRRIALVAAVVVVVVAGAAALVVFTLGAESACRVHRPWNCSVEMERSV